MVKKDQELEWTERQERAFKYYNLSSELRLHLGKDLRRSKDVMI